MPALPCRLQLQELHLLNLESFSPGLAQLSSLVELDLWSSVGECNARDRAHAGAPGTPAMCLPSSMAVWPHKGWCALAHPPTCACHADDEHLPTLWRCSSLTQLGLAQEESSSYSAGVLEHAHLPRLQRLSLRSAPLLGRRLRGQLAGPRALPRECAGSLRFSLPTHGSAPPLPCRHARFPDGTFPPALCVLLPQRSSLTISGAGSWWLPPEISLLTALQELTCSGALQGMRARGQQQRAALAALTALTALTLSEGVVKQGVMPGWAVQLPLLRHVYLPGCQLETLLRKVGWCAACAAATWLSSQAALRQLPNAPK